MKCIDCNYSQTSTYEVKGKTISNTCCDLTHYLVKADVEHNCPCFNADLSQYDICYNCTYYGGGGDWGLFCSHPDNYYHLGKFNDKPCQHYKKKALS